MSKVYIKIVYSDVPMAHGWKIWVDGKRILLVNRITLEGDSVWDIETKRRRVRGGEMLYTSFEADVRVEVGELGLKDIYIWRVRRQGRKRSD